MKDYTVPDYYFDQTISEEEKMCLDLHMIANDFPLLKTRETEDTKPQK